MSSIKLNFLRNLPVSAASGLLYLDEKFYVVADDELSLYSFSKNNDEYNQKIKLQSGDLPESPVERKKQKPDFESLVWLPSIDSILVIPSGSKPNRIRGALVCGHVVQEVSFKKLYEKLYGIIPELNIEGVAILQEELKLFSRGNGLRQQNSIVSLNYKKFLLDLESKKEVSAESLISIQNFSLQKIKNCQLSFTDVAVDAQNRIWYLAAAETGESTYHDGQYLGAVIGCINQQGQILFQKEINSPTKPEGLALDLKNQKFYVVTDADNPRIQAQLFEGYLPDLESKNI